jgi:hypothetical protein
MGFYIPEDTILHSHRHENLKSYFFHFFESSYMNTTDMHYFMGLVRPFGQNLILGQVITIML